MKKIVLLFALLVMAMGMQAQTADKVAVDTESTEPVYTLVEKQAEFVGGMKAMMTFISENIKYPSASLENKSQGRVLVKFIVNSDGALQNLEIVRGSGDEHLDNEALRVIGSMPKWKPALQGGKPVRSYYTVPVIFKLR